MAGQEGTSGAAGRRSRRSTTASRRSYRALSPLFLINPALRRKAVVGARRCGPATPCSRSASAAAATCRTCSTRSARRGAVIGVDLSAGMLAEARKLVDRRGADQRPADRGERRDGRARPRLRRRPLQPQLLGDARPALRPAALARAWERLRPGGRLVVLDGGLARTRLRPLIDPIVRLLIKLGPGDPDADPGTTSPALARSSRSVSCSTSTTSAPSPSRDRRAR